MSKIKMIKIGPKRYSSSLPAGHVDFYTTFPQIALAEQGRSPIQVYKFNLLLDYNRSKHLSTSTYQRVHIINGHCTYKRYTLIDTAIYKLLHMFERSRE